VDPLVPELAGFRAEGPPGRGAVSILTDRVGREGSELESGRHGDVRAELEVDELEAANRRLLPDRSFDFREAQPFVSSPDADPQIDGGLRRRMEEQVEARAPTMLRAAVRASAFGSEEERVAAVDACLEGGREPVAEIYLERDAAAERIGDVYVLHDFPERDGVRAAQPDFRTSPRAPRSEGRDRQRNNQEEAHLRSGPVESTGTRLQGFRHRCRCARRR